MKSENRDPWFKPGLNILMHTQSIVCAIVDSYCLEYLKIYNFGKFVGHIDSEWKK